MRKTEVEITNQLSVYTTSVSPSEIDYLRDLPFFGKRWSTDITNLFYYEKGLGGSNMKLLR